MRDAQKPISEKELMKLAKRFRVECGKTRADAAREMGVSQTSIYQAEEKPEQGLIKLRIKLIEAYSPYSVQGPVFFLQERS